MGRRVLAGAAAGAWEKDGVLGRLIQHERMRLDLQSCVPRPLDVGCAVWIEFNLTIRCE